MSTVAKTVLLCAAFITAVVGLFVYSVTRVPQLSEEEMRDRGVFVLPRPRDIAPFHLEDQNGEAFGRDDLNGKWTFVFFGFTHCPDICPTSMAVLGQVDAELRKRGGNLADQFQGVLVTVDPERDTQALMGRYAEAFSPRFLGVRGTLEETGLFAQQLNSSFGKMPEGDGYTMDHTGHISIINPMGHYHGFIKLPHDPETIRLTYQSLAARF